MNYGAVVEGPTLMDNYSDNRTSSSMAGVHLDTNAGLSGMADVSHSVLNTLLRRHRKVYAFQRSQREPPEARGSPELLHCLRHKRITASAKVHH